MPLKKIFLTLAVIGAMLPTFVFAEDFGLQDAAKGTDLIGRGANVNADQALPELIGTIVGVVLSFVGAIFFLLILYAGLLWMMAFGNTERVDRAKSIIEHAAIGLIIVLAAYAISRFVFSSLTGGGSSQTATVPTQTECTAINNETECFANNCVWFSTQNPPCNNAP